ncbi:MAG: hypothetical protein AAGF95_18690, partial [Chloroflexota bacterium]
MTTIYGNTKLPAERTISQKPVLEQYESDDLPREQRYLQRKLRHHTMSQYRRLAVLVALVNFAFLGFGLTSGEWWSGDSIALGALANLVVGNIAVAILIRQQYVINLLFWIATSAPTSWPLSIRWALGKVYHFGGIHSGCA